MQKIDFSPLHAKSNYLVITKDFVFPVLIICSIIGLWYTVFHTHLFTIDTIICTYDFKPCENDSVLAELAKSKGQNILSFQRDELEAKLKKGDFMVREVGFQKILPRTIEVSLISVMPSVAVQLDLVPNQWVICDQTGRVIGVKDTDPNVPTVIVGDLGVVRAGKTLDAPGINEAIDLARAISDELFHAKSIRIVGEGTIQVGLEGGRLALFTIYRDRGEQIRALQAVLSDSTIIKGVRTIDVRFAQPVLKSD